MRVLLIYPPISKEERYSSAIGSAGGRQMPLGVFYLASSLRRRGHEVAVIDGEAENLTAADILERAEQFQPGLVGISTTTVAFHRALEVARELKRRRPERPIVLGGPHVSSNLAHGMSFAEFDFAIVGEGEKPLADLADALERGSDLAAVASLAYRKRDVASGADIPVCHECCVSPGRQECLPHRGQLIVNPVAPRIDDLDALPFPAYDLAADLSLYTPPPCNYKKLPAANVITSRGCPNQCTFCDRSVFGQLLRQRSAENVAAEIEHLWNEYHVREIAFVDDTFTLRPQRIRELFAILDRKGIRFPWTCMSRVSAVDEDLLRFMRDHGCWHISFGIESGNEEILKRIKKKISLEQARQVIGWCAKLGIRTKGFFIVGHPGETLETIDESIREALRMKLDDVVVTINTPIPGSPQYKEAAANGTLDVTDWSKFNYWRPVFVPHGLTREQLLLKHREFYRRFYFRPRILWRYGLSFLSPSGPRRLLLLLRSLPFLLFREKNKPAGEAEHVAEVGGGSSIPSPHFRRAADRQAAGIEQETAGSQRSPENNR
ncbi:MAG: radical SAM protein [Thermoguttaceae bacterium]